MPASASRLGTAFQYALWRVVPDAERGECLNAGVVLFARAAGFLDARVCLDPGRLGALAPGADPVALAAQLDALARVAAGDPVAGPIARRSPSERFGWLVAPSSTAVRPSPVHSGICPDPGAMLERLYRRLVR